MPVTEQFSDAATVTTYVGIVFRVAEKSRESWKCHVYRESSKIVGKH